MAKWTLTSSNSFLFSLRHATNGTLPTTTALRQLWRNTLPEIQSVTLSLFGFLNHDVTLLEGSVVDDFCPSAQLCSALFLASPLAQVHTQRHHGDARFPLTSNATLWKACGTLRKFLFSIHLQWSLWGLHSPTIPCCTRNLSHGRSLITITEWAERRTSCVWVFSRD